ncbi:MAG: glutathione peroxidase, partial [Ruminococcus sp.]|nr:glutathione peroxidase [Ruminococcus sp.]
MNIYDYSVPRPDGSELKLSEYKGRVMIIVNTATGCGFTPHYEPLEK